MVEGLCEFLMFPRIFSGVKSAVMLSTMFGALLSNGRTLLLVVSLHIE